MSTAVSATDIKNKLGQYLEAAMAEPIIVQKNGRPSSVVLSYKEYMRLLELEDKWWGSRALEAEKGGYLGEKESLELLKKLERRIKNAKD